MDLRSVLADPRYAILRSLVPGTRGSVWRIVLAMVVFDAIGGTVGVLVSFHHSTFMNGWLGGALSMPAGFAVGLWWQLAGRERRKETPVGVVL